MKALTLWQPWATLVAIGEKTIETRSWDTKYRGRLAIHAGKRFPRDRVELCLRPPFADALSEHYRTPGDLPTAAFVAIATLVDVVPVEKVRWDPDVETHEREFGNFEPGRYAWILRDVKAFDPIPFLGSQGLWDVPEGVFQWAHLIV